MTLFPWSRHHAAFSMLFLFAVSGLCITSGCLAESDAQPSPRSAQRDAGGAVQGVPDMADMSTGDMVTTAPSPYLVGQRYPFEDHEKRTRAKMPIIGTRGWTYMPSLHIVDHGLASSTQTLRVFFDRPVDPDSVRVEFESSHEVTWFGDQVMLVTPRVKLAAGTYRVKVLKAKSKDGTTLMVHAALAFEVREVMSKTGMDEPEPDTPTHMSSWGGPVIVMKQGSHTTSKRYIRTTRPEFTFFSSRVLTEDELELGVLFVQERELFGERSRAPFTARTTYHGKSIVGDTTMHEYRARPTVELEQGGRSFFYVSERMKAPDYQNYGGDWNTQPFVIISPEFEVDVTRYATLIELESTHPITPTRLDECLTISPRPRVHRVMLKRKGLYRGYDKTWRFALDIQPAMPGMTYKVTLKAGCRSEFDRPLRGKRSFKVDLISRDQEKAKIGERVWETPYLWAPHSSSAMILESTQLDRKPYFPVLVRHVAQLGVRGYELTERELVRRHLDQSKPAPRSEALVYPPYTSAEKARVIRHDIDLEPLLDGRHRGIIQLDYELTSHKGKVTAAPGGSTVLVSTDLGITRQDGVFWVTRLSTSEPVKGARVSLWKEDGLEEPAATAISDDEGIAQFEPSHMSEFAFVTASHQKDVTFLHTARHTPAHVYLTPPVWSTHTISDRGVYRPGDTMHVTGWVRMRHGQSFKSPEKHTPLRVRLDGPRRAQYECEATFTEFGGWTCDIELAEDAATGEYRASVQFASEMSRNRDNLVHLNLDSSWKVERQAPPRFGVQLRRSPRDKVSAQVHRHAGAPIARAAISYEISEQPSQTTHPDFKGYLFGADAEEIMLGSGDTRTNKEGIASFALPTSKSGSTPRRTRIEVTARDIDGSAIAQRLSWISRPRVSYGLRLEEEDTHEPLRVDVAAINESGARVKSGALTVELVHRSRVSARKIGPGGQWVREYTTKEKIEETCKVRSARTPMPCLMTPDDSAEYAIRLRQGRTLVAEVVRDVRASWGTSSERARQVRLTAREPYYVTGQAAELLLESPYIEGAHALITMRGHGDEHLYTMLWQDVVPLTSRAQILRVPLDETMLPQPVSVTVTVVQGRKPEGVGRDRLWYPSTTSNLFWESTYGSYTFGGPVTHKQWSPQVDGNRPVIWTEHVRFEVHEEHMSRKSVMRIATDAEQVEPGDDVQVELELEDFEGTRHGGEAIVMIVDEGALALSAHRLHRPSFEMMLGPVQPASVEDSRARLTTPVEMGMKSNPGGGGMAPEEILPGGWRDEDVLTAHVERMQLDEQGHGMFTFKAPERLSRYRIMAFGTHGMRSHQFATASAALTVAKPLQLRPSMPRFVSQGDALQVRAMVISTVNGEADATLQTSRAATLAVPTTRTQRIRLKANEPTWVSWPVKIEAARRSEFSFMVHGLGLHEDLEDRVRVELPVRTLVQDQDTLDDPWHHELRQDELWRGQSTGRVYASGVALPIHLEPFNEEASSAQLTLTVRRDTQDQLARLIQSLIVYPHGCGEQTSSKLHAVLVGASLDDTTRSKLKINEDLAEFARGGIARLQSMYVPGQGVPIWPGGQASPWITIYTTWALLRAQEMEEVEVPRVFLDGLLDILELQVKQEVLQSSPEMAAFAHWLLSRAGRANEFEIDVLYKKRDALTRVEAAMLALTYAQLEQPRRQKIMLEHALDDGVLLSHAKVSYHSERRAWAMVLLAAARLEAPAAAQQKLIGQLVDSSGYGTQSRAFAGLALYEATLRAASRDDEPMHVLIGWNDEVKHVELLDQEPVHVTIPLGQLKGVKDGMLYIDLNAHDRSHVYFTLDMQAPLRASEKTRWKQLQAERLLVMASGPRRGQVIDGDLSVGDLVLVHHIISCKTRRDMLAITDPLPAGFERVKQGLATTSSREARLIDELIRESPALQSWSASSTTVQDYTESIEVGEGLYPGACKGTKTMSYLVRAVAPGTFLAPATYMEYMYAEQFNARSHPDEVVVIRP